jgi:hypothetical protein
MPPPPRENHHHGVKRKVKKIDPNSVIWISYKSCNWPNWPDSVDDLGTW